jgi:hypothetical protein
MGQRPPPSQLAAGVYALPTQVARRQPVAVDQGRHAPLPLQVPSKEQSPFAGLLATQRCFGSACPSGTAEQVPTLPVTLQLAHRPPESASLQAELQQTPSVQKPLLHWSALVQAAPFGLRPHELFSQVLGGTQSASDLQVVRHALLAQMKLPQETSAGATQAPLPSQLEPGCSVVEPPQLGGLQGVELSKKAHSPPRHAPVVPQPPLGDWAHFSWGSGLPSATAMHNPMLPARLHALHASSQRELQQTPCAQKPERQSMSELHSAPSGCLPHLLSLQVLGGTQSVSLVQLRRQVLPLHT